MEFRTSVPETLNSDTGVYGGSVVVSFYFSDVTNSQLGCESGVTSPSPPPDSYRRRTGPTLYQFLLSFLYDPRSDVTST